MEHQPTNHTDYFHLKRRCSRCRCCRYYFVQSFQIIPLNEPVQFHLEMSKAFAKSKLYPDIYDKLNSLLFHPFAH